MRISDFFFFQAEDGIRYYKVTGVQTCALPIYRGSGGGRYVAREPRAAPGRAAGTPRARPRVGHGGGRRPAGRGDRKSVGEGKRVDLGGRRIIKKKKNDKHTWQAYLLQLALQNT